MSEAFSFNREYDFIRLEGLGRATGRPSHEWDIYILKELIDNALDADELEWGYDSSKFPWVGIRLEYIQVPPPQERQLIVWVWNRAQFPTHQLQSIFSTQWYTSRKAFMKGLTRGVLGNALKTLLGIPYALHNHVAGDWKPDLKPLSIYCGGTEYLPRFIVDPIEQSLQLECDTKPSSPVAGTVISVGLDYFAQERPRTLAEIETLALQYHLCNPHVEFQWTVEIDGRSWTKKYRAQTQWHHKFYSQAPVQWYSLDNFKNVLGALQRKIDQQRKGQQLPVQELCQYFSGICSDDYQAQQRSPVLKEIIAHTGRGYLERSDINGPTGKILYEILARHTPPFDARQLGSIGQEHLHQTLSNHLPILGKMQYKLIASDNDDPQMPFILEVAVAYLKEGCKRQLWTAINFSPTYDDPFLSRWLYSPAQPEPSVLGLRGFLDSYGFREDAPLVLFLHLICPTIKHHDFSKTEIDHFPFKKTLGKVLDSALNDLKHEKEEEEMQLKKIVFQALDTIHGKLAGKERFISEQLLEALRQHLSQDETLTAWLAKPDTPGRLRAYIASYQYDYPSINRFVARPIEALLYIPSHPQRYFSIPVEYVSRDLPEQHNINKILFVSARELEPVVLDNNWLCKMDMALLHAPARLDALEEALSGCAESCDLPILFLHHGDEEGYTLFAQIQALFKRKHLDESRLVDLSQSSSINETPTRGMPHEQEFWLLKRFAALGISTKYIPLCASRDIRERFEHQLSEFILKGIGKQFALDKLLLDLDARVSYTEIISRQAFLEKLKQDLCEANSTESYSNVLETVTEKFFMRFKQYYEAQVHQVVQEWITKE